MSTILKLLFEAVRYSARLWKKSDDEGLRVLGGSAEALTHGTQAMIDAADAASEGESGYRAILDSFVGDLIATVGFASFVSGVRPKVVRRDWRCCAGLEAF